MRGYLVSFLLSLAGRSPGKDRVNLFTTNYDRLIEYACEVAGLRVLDRFVGQLSPRFRSSRVEIDLHYSPPGVVGEPRFLDGVVRLTKLHGSLDWSAEVDRRGIVRRPMPFGASDIEAEGDLPIIYPNSAKDFETAFYPYADLFRDLSAALCRPNNALVVFGYSFGDDHVNRIIADMLSIPSTHLMVIAWEDTGGRVSSFVSQHGREGQVSLLVGPRYASLVNLVDDLLPVPASDQITWQRAQLTRTPLGDDTNPPPTGPA